MLKIDTREKCPNCFKPHKIPNYIHHKERNRILWLPSDIRCTCGVILRVVIPSKFTNSGYMLRLVNLDETIRE